MTPVVGTSSVVFHSYNDDLGTLDDVINGVGKIRHPANDIPGSTSLNWAGAFRILSMVDTTASKNRSAASRGLLSP